VVDVMDDLVRGQWTAEILLHDGTMQSNPPAVLAHVNVALVDCRFGIHTDRATV
jgi:hypothetical protein